MRSFLILLINLFLFSLLEGQPERRAALDLGSSTVKIEIADVEGGQVSEPLYSDKISVPIRASLSPSNTIPPAVEEQLQNALTQHLEVAYRLEADAICGIATAAYREADNGLAVIARQADSLGIPLHIISQEEEGRLGYAAATALSGIENAVVWDSGGGSFQLARQTDGGLEVYHGPIGRIAALEGLESIAQGRPYITPSEAKGLCHLLKEKITGPRPEWLDRSVVAIASICEVAAEELGKDHFTREEIHSLILGSGAKPDLLYRLCLIHAVMDHLEIDSATVFPANGSCRGLLVDSQYWAPASLEE